MADVKMPENITSVSERLQTKDIIKIIIAVTVAIIVVVLTGLICLVIYNNGLIVESILFLLLAFFSIFISIFFYFKADETSSKFYESSYNFMKDQAVLLGRIEERFSEKFENLFSRIDHLDIGQAVKEDQIDDKREEISLLVNEILTYLSNNSEEKSTEDLQKELKSYQKKLEEKNIEYHEMLTSLHDIRQESQEIRHYVEALQRLGPGGTPDKVFHFLTELDVKDVNYLLRCGGRIQRSNRTYNIARRYNLCDEKGRLSQELITGLKKVANRYT